MTNKHLFLVLFLTGLFSAVMACSNSNDMAGSSPAIDSQFYSITFSGQTMAGVTFNHLNHADYFGSNCLQCHSHTDIRDEVEWNCRACHSADDAEGLCAQDGDHNCMFFQCLNCHQNLLVNPVNPTPNCSDCHIESVLVPPGVPTAYLGVIGDVTGDDTEVDKIKFSLSGDAITVDLLSFEDGSSHATGDLGLEPGVLNDLLVSNIFLFQLDGTLVGSKTGTAICNACSSCHWGPPKDSPGPGYPGCDAPGAFAGRSPFNPYLQVTGLSPGEYILAIGAQHLTEADAWAGSNQNLDRSGWAAAPNFNNDQVTITVN